MDAFGLLCSNNPAMRSSPTFSPLYRQIKRLLIDALEAGEWRPGHLIPSEQELAGRFGVSQGTVRKAIDELAAENLLIRRQGKGTFVASHQDPRALFRFLRLLPLEGELATPESVPLDCRHERAGAEAARMLGIAQGDPVIILCRVLRFEGNPVVIDEIYLPGTVFQGLTLALLQAWGSSLYSLFETRFGVRMIRARESIRAVAADRAAADMLQVEVGKPLLSVERTTYTYGDRPAEWRRGLYLTDAHFYMNELN